jgi:ketosteroid isomerase-like protein
MSEQNVQVVVKQFEDVNVRDFPAAMEAYADDVTLVFHGDGLLRQTATGREAVGEWFGDWFRQFGRDYRFDIEEARGAGDRVFIRATHRGRGRESGVPVEETWAYLYGVRDGRVTQVELWNDRDCHEVALAKLLSYERLALVERGLAAFNDRDLDTLLAAYTDDAEWRLHGGLDDLVGTEVKGREAVRSFLGDWIENLGSRVEPERVLEADGRVVAMLRLESSGGASGAPTTQRIGQVYSFRDEQIRVVDNYWQAGEALEAVGLRS